MATVIQTTNIGTGINVSGASFVYVKDGVLVSHTTGPGINADAGNTRITVEGEVTAVTQGGIVTGNAAEAFGVGNSRLIVGESGMVSGASSAVSMGGTGNHVDNHGLIAENGSFAIPGTGIQFFQENGGVGGNNSVNNTGTITADDIGILFTAGSALGTNEVLNSGTITVGQTAIQFDGGANGVLNTVINSGHIDGGPVAIQGSEFGEYVRNTGVINGSVNLGGGLDQVDNSGGGIIEGLVNLGAGDDFFTGSDGNDLVLGDIGNDTIDMGGGDDTYRAGHTTLDPSDGKDEIDGGLAGERGNTYDASSISAAMNISLGDQRASGNSIGTDIIFNFQNVLGGLGADIIEGDGGNNRLKGLGGADTLSGLSGNDRLNGGAGADTITGGQDKDVMTGSFQGDEFGFGFSAVTGKYDSGVGAGNRDVITDFAAGSDSIDLSDIDANANTLADNAFSFIGNAAFGNVAGQLRAAVVNGGRATLIEADTTGDGQADFQIILHGNVGLAATDFDL